MKSSKKNSSKTNTKNLIDKNALKAAFPLTLPIMAGYLFFGIAFGILMTSKGYSTIWTFFMSLLVFAGSMQFVTIGLLTTIFAPINALMMTLLVNARHLFYGISMLKLYKATGAVKPFLIFGLTDETFSLVCSVPAPEGIAENSFFFFITLLDYIYWVGGSVLGAMLGAFIPFDLSGIEFAMTALFVVIFIDQWQSQSQHIPAITGVIGSLVCLILFGPDAFILPAMILIVSVLLALRPLIDK